MKTTNIIYFLVTSLLFYNISIFAQNEDIYDTNNYNPDVANGNIVIDDTQITSDVKQAISSNPSVSNLPVKVSSQRGIVQLTGHVNSVSEYIRLIKLARSVRGVHNVDAQDLTVKTGM